MWFIPIIQKIFRRFKYGLVFLLILTALIILFNSCTPQKRLNRILRNHPYLADTVYSTKSITVPALRVDTFFKASNNTAGLDSILNTVTLSVVETQDSLLKAILASKIKPYIINRNCIEDTLTINLQARGSVKVWQQGGKFHFTADIPAATYNIRVPAVQFNYQSKSEWKWGIAGFFLGFLALFIFIMLYGRALKGRDQGNG